MAETTEQYRTRINQLKTSIENEPYMMNMRPDIAEGIGKTGNRQADIENQFKSVIDGTTDKDIVSAPEILAARTDLNGTRFRNLKEKNDAFEQETAVNLAQTNSKKADTGYVDQQISTISGGAIKGTFTTLVALKSAYPAGAIGPFQIIEEENDRYVWDVNKLDWVSIGPYEPAEIGEGDVTTKAIAEEAVTFEKIDPSDKTINILNKNDLMAGQYYGLPEQNPNTSLGKPILLKTNALWNGSTYPIPVKKGDIVRFNKVIYAEYYIGVDDNNIIRQYGTSYSSLTSATITVVDGVTGFYATVRGEHLDSTMITINNQMPTTYIANTTKKSLKWLEVLKENLPEYLKNLPGSWFQNMVANFLGDSLTIGQFLDSVTLSWPSLVGKKLGLAAVNNYGISGSSISTYGTNPMVNRYKNMTAADVIFFMGGRNDFGSSTDAFGDINTPSTATNTYYGALKNIAEGLKAKYPGKLIIFCTPPHGSSATIPEDRPNPTTGKTYVQYVQAIRDVANYYGIPVCDFWNNSGMQPLVQIDNETYFKHKNGTMDGVHPNETGHENLARVASGFVKTLVS